MNILEIVGLSKSYDGKKYALSDCSFTLQKGKICAVVGESGSGKSTLLRLIAGLERSNSGTVSIKNKLVSSDSIMTAPQDRNVGFVFQDYALFPHLTVAQNIVFGLKSNKKERLNTLLSLIELEGYADVYPGQLSGGQQQRVALARTLALHPELLLLDEPFSNLDADLKGKLRKDIRNIIRKVNTSMLFITHDICDAIDIADEIILLNKGKVIHHSDISDFAKNVQSNQIREMLTNLKTNSNQILNFISDSTQE
ncbi:MAG: ABC transporter ATP-binding protein [Flavicella sp.]